MHGSGHSQGRTLSKEAQERIAEAGKVRPVEAKPFPTTAELERFHHVLALAEFAAPVDTTGPLPFRTHTLAWIPPQRRGQYAREMDGNFRLAWYTEGDTATEVAYVNQLAKELAAKKADPTYQGLFTERELRVYPEGMSPAHEAAAHEAEQRQQQAVLDEVARAEREDAQAKQAAEVEALRVKQQAEMDRITGQKKRDDYESVLALAKEQNPNVTI